MIRTAAQWRCWLLIPVAICSTLVPIERTSAQTNIDVQIRENRMRLDSIRREREVLANERERLRGQVRDIAADLRIIEQQRDITTRVVNELDRQMATMTSELDTLTMDLLMAQDALAETRAILSRRLVEIYKRGPLYGFQVVLGAESFGDLLSRYKYLYLIGRQDRALVDEIEDLENRVRAQRRRQLNVQNELSVQLDDRGAELRRYQNLERQRQNILSQTRRSQQAAASRIDSLAILEEQLGSIINRLEEERRRAIARGDRTESSITRDDLGRLPWPVDGGRVVYEFGRYRQAGNDMIRQGIGIAVPAGTPVRAVASGNVRFAEPYGTYGLTVMISHGGGFYTLYLYLNGLQVREGQIVQAGQVLGRSGGENSEEGPHIELQVREGNVTLDPRVWLRQRR